MSKISVTTIAGLTSGGDANKVKIESGDTLEVVNGSQTINRTGDGTTLTLQAGGTTFGTIGQDGSDLVIDGPSGHTGLRMTTSGLLPRQNGAIIDNTIDLGSGAYRYNDLYLGGGLYVGGTGASNYLDDYEEGTWTPAVTGSTTPPNSITTGEGVYTKVGNQVMLAGVVNNINITNAAGNCQITGMPFPCQTGISGGNVPGTLYLNQFVGLGGLANSKYAVVEATTGQSYLQIRIMRSSNTNAAVVPLNSTYFTDDQTDIRFQITYRTNA